MGHQIRQAFRSGKFLTGFIIFASLLLITIFYPIASPGNPLLMIGLDSFVPPGTYVNLYDSLAAQKTYTFRLPEAADNRIESRLSQKNRLDMQDYLKRAGLFEDDIDIYDTEALLELWWEYYDPAARLGSTIAENRYFTSIDNWVRGIFDTSDYKVYEWASDEGAESLGINDENHFIRGVRETDYVIVSDIANVVRLPLGTDNFGSDMFRKLVRAISVSLQIGLIAGSIATLIGLVLGLVSGYVGSVVDDIIMFFINLFTVIPGFVLLILISFSIGQEQRGAITVAAVIGFTSWVWTARSVRSQVLSLRNRDHVSLSKLSGHSMMRIIFKDIFPYIASYVMMAFILQVSSGILAEAGLSMLGLGPSTTELPTLGLMMQWAMRFGAHLSGAWWAFYPVILVIALMSFSLNLMNTGLDQIFNPQLRE